MIDMRKKRRHGETKLLFARHKNKERKKGKEIRKKGALKKRYNLYQSFLQRYQKIPTLMKAHWQDGIFSMEIKD